MLQFQRELRHEINASCNAPVNLLRLPVILQVGMVGPNCDFVWGSNEDVSPIAQCFDYRKELPVPDVIVALSRVQCLRVVAYIALPALVVSLEQDSAYCKGRCVHFQFEWTLQIWKCKYWRTCNHLDKL